MAAPEATNSRRYLNQRLCEAHCIAELFRPELILTRNISLLPFINLRATF
jgi:hypothetical protein